MAQLISKPAPTRCWKEYCFRSRRQGNESEANWQVVVVVAPIESKLEKISEIYATAREDVQAINGLRIELGRNLH